MSRDIRSASARPLPPAQITNSFYHKEKTTKRGKESEGKLRDGAGASRRKGCNEYSRSGLNGENEKIRTAEE